MPTGILFVFRPFHLGSPPLQKIVIKCISWDVAIQADPGFVIGGG